MFRRLTNILIALLSLALSNKATLAQDVKGQLNITAEAGYSPQFNGLIVAYLIFGYPVVSNFNSYTSVNVKTPQLGLNADYGIGKRFTLGIAGSYQQEEVYTTDLISRTNIATRFLYHWGKNISRVDNYLGMRLGCSYWTDAYTPDPSLNLSYYTPGIFIHHTSLLVFSGQLVYGAIFYLEDDLGINIALGIGAPYFAAAGFTYKLESRHNTPTNP